MKWNSAVMEEGPSTRQEYLQSFAKRNVEGFMANVPHWLNQPLRGYFISGRAPQEVTATELLQYPCRISTEDPEAER